MIFEVTKASIFENWNCVPDYFLTLFIGVSLKIALI